MSDRPTPTDEIQRRIDEWNKADGYPPATDWPTRVNDAYHLGWRDSQIAMRRQAVRLTWWQRFRHWLRAEGSAPDGG